VVERFFRKLKTPVVRGRIYRTVADPAKAEAEFAALYNDHAFRGAA
jgi:hypothetical protein